MVWKKLAAGVLVLILAAIPVASGHAAGSRAMGSPCVTQCDVHSYPHLPPVTLPDGGKEYTYPVPRGEVVIRIPPPGFHPLTASASELATYRLPERPSGGAQLEHWKSMMANPHFVVPPDVLTSVTVASTSPGSYLNVVSITHQTWAGYIVNDNTNMSAYKKAEGIFTEPTKYATSCPAYPRAGFWVGLGGVHTQNLAQVGTGLNTAANLQDHQVWWVLHGASFTPAPAYDIYGNIMVTAPGDLVTLYARYNGVAHQVEFYAYDGRTNQLASWLQSDSSYNYDGSDAEYITERPSYGPTSVGLVNYGVLHWTAATVDTQGTSYYINDPNANLPLQNVTMISSTGMNMATTSGFTNSQGGFDSRWVSCGY